MRTPVWCRSRAEALGEHVTELVVGLLADHALHHLRAAQGIIGLGERYGAERLDAACRRALEVGDPSYRTVKGILAVGADQQGAGGPVSAASASTPAHLHGPQGLFAHLNGDGAGGDGAGGDGDWRRRRRCGRRRRRCGRRRCGRRRGGGRVNRNRTSSRCCAR